MERERLIGAVDEKACWDLLYRDNAVSFAFRKLRLDEKNTFYNLHPISNSENIHMINADARLLFNEEVHHKYYSLTSWP